MQFSGLAAMAIDPLAETQKWMNTLDADALARSNAYFVGGYWLILWNFLIGITIAWILLSGKRAARTRDWLQGKLPGFLVKPAFAFMYLLVTAILAFPMTVYEGFFREAAYDLMNQSFGQWFGVQLTSLAVTLLLGTLALWGLFALINWLGNAWRWWGALAATAFMAFLMMIAPVFIAPLFNDYTPMPDSPLKAEILSIAESYGVPADNVYVFNVSKQSDRVTANVSGFLGTTRISLSDTLLQQVSPEGVKAVMAHEIVHYVLHHGPEMLVDFAVLIFIGFAFTHWAYGWMQHRWGKQWGIGKIGDIAGMPLFFAVISVFFFLATPVTNSIVRSNEVEADIFGLSAAQEPDGFAEAIMKLAKYRKMHPGKWEEIVFFDHPSGYNRILHAMRWKAGHEKYQALMKANPPPAKSD